jgi:nitrite reductase/ring-hydroxylating ferredoxin subunit
MAESTTAGCAAQHICAAAELPERGRGQTFDIEEFKRPARAFVLRIEGQVVGYVNRCAHVPVELDWQPGEFLDAEKREIICSVHGATYDPLTGACTGGPAGRGRLKPLRVAEIDGQVYWYPSADLQPPSFE